VSGRPVAGPGPGTLLHNGTPIAPLVVADTPASRAKGLLGTSGIEGALWLEPCPSVHMMGMRYAIDAATLAADGTVLDVRTLRPWVGMTPVRRRAHVTVETAAGFLAAHGVVVGDRLTIGPGAG
jgi:uncharacterized membrane protein (UPF0127 family)